MLNWIHDHKVFDGKFEQEFGILKCCFAVCNNMQSIALTVQSIALVKFAQIFENLTVQIDLHSSAIDLHRDKMHFFGLVLGRLWSKMLFLLTPFDCRFGLQF